MHPSWMIRCFPPVCAIVIIASGATSCRAQVREIVVGITMTCPYENAIEGNCWSGARAALKHLEGIKSVDEAANGYNCTARVSLEHASLPDPDKWAAQFKKLVDQNYMFRGVEVTVDGTVGRGDNGIKLRIPGVEQPLTLQSLEHKLQWNARKGAARQPEPDERDAYNQLAAKLKDTKDGELKAKVTGRLMNSDTGYKLEVREFFQPAAK